MRLLCGHHIKYGTNHSGPHEHPGLGMAPGWQVTHSTFSQHFAAGTELPSKRHTDLCQRACRSS